MKRNQLKLF